MQRRDSFDSHCRSDNSFRPLPRYAGVDGALQPLDNPLDEQPDLS